MAGNLARELHVEAVMEHEGTMELGSHRLLRSGPSVGGLIPKDHARALGAIEAGETDVFVNYELGIVMHRIPQVDRDEQE